MTTYQFHFPAGAGPTITIPIPEELRDEPLKIVVGKESTILSEQKNTNETAFHATKKGILGLRGILKGRTMEELENARDEYLIEKYVHGKNKESDFEKGAVISPPQRGATR